MNQGWDDFVRVFRIFIRLLICQGLLVTKIFKYHDLIKALGFGRFCHQRSPKVKSFINHQQDYFSYDYQEKNNFVNTDFVTKLFLLDRFYTQWKINYCKSLFAYLIITPGQLKRF